MTDETFNPWWGDKVVADAERERLARQQDKVEAEKFAAKIKAKQPRAGGIPGDGWSPGRTPSIND